MSLIIAISAIRFPLVVLLPALALAACSSEPVGPGPAQVGEQYYEAVKAGDFGAAAALYVQDVPREAVVAELVANRQRLGDLESYRRTDLVSYTTSGGMRYTLRFMTRYANGHAIEGLMLFQSATDNVVRIEEKNQH